MAAMESPEPELSGSMSEASGDEDSEELCAEMSENEKFKNGDFSDDDGNLDSDIDGDLVVSYLDALLQGLLHDSVQARIHNRTANDGNQPPIENKIQQKMDAANGAAGASSAAMDAMSSGRRELHQAVSLASAVKESAEKESKKKKKNNDEPPLSAGWSDLDVFDFAPQDVRFKGSGPEGKVNLPPNSGIDPPGDLLRDGKIIQEKTLPFFKLFVTDEMMDLDMIWSPFALNLQANDVNSINNHVAFVSQV
jgi:hypothetical protein